MRNKDLVHTVFVAGRRVAAALAAWGMAGWLAGCATPPATAPATPASCPTVAAPATTPASAPEVAPPPVVVPPPVRRTRPARIGLALGGGAARGFAHIGVIEVLEANGIHPDLVTGTSAGSLVAALYASGKTGRELERLALSMDESEFTDWSFPGRGLIRGEALARYVRKETGDRTIEHMKLPLGIVATDLRNGRPILFRRGDAGTAVRASSAVPAVFQPVPIAGHEYVDGGLVSPVPVRFARAMGADVVIAVDISSPPDGSDTSDALHMLLQTFSIMGRSIDDLELKEADVVVRPHLAGAAATDFTQRRRSIEAGREAALAMLPAIRAAVSKPVPVEP